MGIAFDCQHCGAHYEVDPRLAGRKARCKSCKGQMLVPLRSGAAVASREPALAAASTASAGMFPSEIGLAPLDDDADPGLRETQKQRERKFSYNPALDAPSTDALPQLVPTHIALPKLARQGGGRPPSAAAVLWRQGVTRHVKLLRGISDFAYLLTVPLILAFIIGILIRREALAYPAAVAIVLLNLGRLLLDGVALFSLPFKSGPVQGFMFLIPPLTFIYLAQHWRKMKKATLRFLAPALPILLVALAFTFIPWLHTGGKDDRVEALRERVSAAEAAVGVDSRELEGLGQRARDGVQRAREAVESKKDALRNRP